jgi:hypothetical protein
MATIELTGRINETGDLEVDLPEGLPTGVVKVIIEVPAAENVNASTSPTPRRSLLGLCADLGPAPSAEDIDEARREMWSGFPREDIAS